MPKASLREKLGIRRCIKLRRNVDTPTVDATYAAMERRYPYINCDGT